MHSSLLHTMIMNGVWKKNQPRTRDVFNGDASDQDVYKVFSACSLVAADVLGGLKFRIFLLWRVCAAIFICHVRNGRAGICRRPPAQETSSNWRHI